MGAWTEQEDRMLRAALSLVGLPSHENHISWVEVANHVPNRGAKSCRLRWDTQLADNIDFSKFSAQEEAFILEYQALRGNKWAEMAKMLSDKAREVKKERFRRTDNQVKNLWHCRHGKKNSPPPQFCAPALKRCRLDDRQTPPGPPFFVILPQMPLQQATSGSDQCLKSECKGSELNTENSLLPTQAGIKSQAAVSDSTKLQLPSLPLNTEPPCQHGPKEKLEAQKGARKCCVAEKGSTCQELECHDKGPSRNGVQQRGQQGLRHPASDAVVNLDARQGSMSRLDQLAAVVSNELPESFLIPNDNNQYSLEDASRLPVTPIAENWRLTKTQQVHRSGLCGGKAENSLSEEEKAVAGASQPTSRDGSIHGQGPNTPPRCQEVLVLHNVAHAASLTSRQNSVHSLSVPKLTAGGDNQEITESSAPQKSVLRQASSKACGSTIEPQSGDKIIDLKGMQEVCSSSNTADRLLSLAPPGRAIGENPSYTPRAMEQGLIPGSRSIALRFHACITCKTARKLRLSFMASETWEILFLGKPSKQLLREAEKATLSSSIVTVTEPCEGPQYSIVAILQPGQASCVFPSA